MTRRELARAASGALLATAEEIDQLAETLEALKTV